jgi:hypothetical protein
MINGGQPFTASQARQLTGRRAYRLVGAGAAREVLHGIYLDVEAPDDVATRAAAAALALPAGAVLCRSTVAWLRGIGDVRLPHQRDDPLAIECVVEAGRTPVRRAGVRCYSAPLRQEDIVLDECFPRTTDLRTALDLARWIPRPMALASLDAAAHLGLIDLAQAQEEIGRFAGHRGAAQARELIAHAEPLTESFGESWLRLRVLDAGFPRPTAQIPVHDHDGRLVYRLDLGDERKRVGMEYDGDEHHGTIALVRADDHRRERLRREFGWDVVGFHRGHVWGTSLALERAVGELLGLEPQVRLRRW